VTAMLQIAPSHDCRQGKGELLDWCIVAFAAVYWISLPFQWLREPILLPVLLALCVLAVRGAALFRDVTFAPPSAVSYATEQLLCMAMIIIQVPAT